ncbi:MAG: transporter permease [Dactylosporangium sp.]|nr:transporter permease [Dactylosporangium sp.]
MTTATLERPQAATWPRRSQFRLAMRALRRDKVAAAALVVLALVTLAAIFAPLISPEDPLVGNPRMRLLPPGTPGHLLGLDGQGRDILSRLIWGGRYSLSVAVVPVVCAGAVALVIGMASGYSGGRWGELVMRVLDIVFAFPIVLFAIAIAAVLGPGLLNSMVAIGITLVPYMARVVYTATVQEAGKDYVEAARAAGANRLEILYKQLLPNVLSPLVVYGTTLAGLVIVLAAGLSFLGV